MNNTTTFDIFGYCGSVTLTFMLIPQLIHTYRVKDASNLDWTFLALQFLSALFGLIYGIGVYRETDLITALPIFVQNPSVLISTIILIYMKFIYDKKKVIEVDSPPPPPQINVSDLHSPQRSLREHDFPPQ